MAPMGGGLMQLVAYGAQDNYSSVYENDYCLDDCIQWTKLSNRKYNNFDCVERVFYVDGNKSFTNNKYNEYCIKIKKTKFMKFKNNKNFSYTIQTGNDELNAILTIQLKLAIKLRNKDNLFKKVGECINKYLV